MRKQLGLAVFIVLLELSLVVAGFAFAQATTVHPMSSPVIIATPTPTPSPTPTPAPTPSPTPVPSVSLDYDEVSQTTDGGDTVVILRITATYNFGDTLTVDYRNFVLNIRTSRGGLEPYPIYLLTDTAHPLETGSVTVGSSNRYAEFTLTFRFSTIQSSFGGNIHFAYYELVYNSNAISTATPSPTLTGYPTEIPITTPSNTPPPFAIGNPLGMNSEQTTLMVLAIVIIALLAIIVVVLLYHRKNQKPF